MTRPLLLLSLCSVAIISAQAADPEAKSVTSFPQVSAAEEKIQQTLMERTELAFTDTPLVDAFGFLRELHQVNIVVDVAALQDDGIDPNTPINLELSGITLRSTLRLMLQPLKLTYVVQDEVLKITTQAKESTTFVTRVYPVFDLADDPEELESVVDAIQAGCGGSQWGAKHGASIVGVIRSRAIVIRQTRQIHEEISELLQNLRDADAILQMTQERN